MSNCVYGNLPDNVETQTEKKFFLPESVNCALNPQRYNSVGVKTGTWHYGVIQMPCGKHKRQIREGGSRSLASLVS